MRNMEIDEDPGYSSIWNSVFCIFPSNVYRMMENQCEVEKPDNGIYHLVDMLTMREVSWELN